MIYYHSCRPSGQKIAVISGYHDYRTRKRVALHEFVANWAQVGHDVIFISTRFSWLSRFRIDSRNFLRSRANRVENIGGVRCFLWQTIFHPPVVGFEFGNYATGLLFPLYSRLRCKQFDELISSVDTVIVDSSVAAIYIIRIRKLNKDCQIIYYAADRLDTAGVHPYVLKSLRRSASLVDYFVVRSAKFAKELWFAHGRLYEVGFGVNHDDFARIGPSPYGSPLNVISVGSMLFDATFFQIVAPKFPSVEFHVIGCGTSFEAPGNVHIYPEMEFRDTLPYLKHASVGVAPYKPSPAADYLADTSLKLAQYEYLGIPAVCPEFAVGDSQSRFGYTAGDARSMKAAMERALSTGKVEPRRFPSWAEIAERVLQLKRS